MTNKDEMTLIEQLQNPPYIDGGYLDPDKTVDLMRTAAFALSTMIGVASKAAARPAQEPTRTCATCHAVLADGPQPAACYEAQEPIAWREAFRKLLRTASLLQQNSIGCATLHHGLDVELNGLPGWLADTKKSLDEAETFLSQSGDNQSAPDRYPSHNSGERLPSSDAAGSGADTAHTSALGREE